MKTADSRFLIRSIIGAGLLLGGSLLAAQSAMAACTAGNWNGGVTGTVTAGEPAPIARYAGLCAMQTGDGIVSYVQDNSPGNIDRIRARFYVLVDDTQTQEAVIYRGLNSSDSPIFGVRLNPGTGNVTLTGSGASAICNGCANIGDWNSIEIDWNNAGAGSMSLWVNSNAATDPADATTTFSSSATVSSVRLGNLNGAAGTLNFDAYESRLSTAVGRLCGCNANGSADGVVNIQDIITMTNEIGGASLSSGTPDCNDSGEVSIQDLILTVNIVGDAAVCQF